MMMLMNQTMAHCMLMMNYCCVLIVIMVVVTMEVLAHRPTDVNKYTDTGTDGHSLIGLARCLCPSHRPWPGRRNWTQGAECWVFLDLPCRVQVDGFRDTLHGVLIAARSHMSDYECAWGVHQQACHLTHTCKPDAHQNMQHTGCACALGQQACHTSTHNPMPATNTCTFAYAPSVHPVRRICL